jgi:hypothetical protein
MLNSTWKVAGYRRTRTPKTVNNKANQQPTKKHGFQRAKVSTYAGAKVAQCLFFLELKIAKPKRNDQGCRGKSLKNNFETGN